MKNGSLAARTFILTALIFSLAGCASSPPVRYYTLTPVGHQEGVTSSQDASKPFSLGIAALATAIYNDSEYNRWVAANDSLRRNLTKLEFDKSASQERENEQLMHRIQTRRTVAIGLGIASGVVTASGVDPGCQKRCIVAEIAAETEHDA